MVGLLGIPPFAGQGQQLGCVRERTRATLSVWWARRGS
jgi:hypothetical protein